MSTLRQRFADFTSPVHVIILLHTLGTLYLAHTLNIWTDEAFTFDTTARSIDYAVRQSLGFELQPPAYFVVLCAWRKLNESIFFARLFSIVSIALALKLAASVARRYVPQMNPAWLVLVLACHPFVVWAAVEMRVYAFVVLLAASLMLLFFDGYVGEQREDSETHSGAETVRGAERRRRFARALYFVVAIVSLYTHYYLGFLFVAHFLSLVWLRRWRALLAYTLKMCAVAALFAPLVFFTLDQFTAGTQTLARTTSFVESLQTVYWRALEYVFSATTEILMWWRKWMSRAVVLTLCAFLVRRILAKRGRVADEKKSYTASSARETPPGSAGGWLAPFAIDSEVTRFVLITTTFLTGAFFFVVVLRLTGHDFFYARHTVVLFLPTLLFVFACLAAAGNRTFTGAVVLTMIVFNVLTLVSDYAPLAKPGDWRRLAAYIHAREQPRQPILVFHAASQLPLARHYAGANQIVALPSENDLTKFDVRSYVVRDEAQLVRRLEEVGAAGDERVWLVKDDYCAYLSIDYNCQTLEAFVEKFYETEDRAKFYRSTVRLLRRKR